MIFLSHPGYASSIAGYLHDRSPYDLCVLYEDLAADPAAALARVFAAAGIDPSHLPLALKAMRTDSQKGTFGSRGTSGTRFDEAQALAASDAAFAEVGSGLRADTGPEEMRRMLGIE